MDAPETMWRLCIRNMRPRPPHPHPPLTCTVTDVADVADLRGKAPGGTKSVADGLEPSRNVADPAATTCPECDARGEEIHRRGCRRRPRIVAL